MNYIVNLNLIKLLLIFVYIQTCHCFVLPTPTRSTSSYQQHQQPTLFTDQSQLLERNDGDLQATLNLYQNWASICNEEDDYRGYRKNVVLDNDPKLQQLWQTVTKTVNCGHGTIKTVTKTKKVASTATAFKGTLPVCTGKCWSDYLWRK
jgi:hypothetical protein